MSDTHSPLPPPSPERRKFLKWVTHGLGALFGVVLGAPAVAYVLDALNRSARNRGFKRVARVSELELNVPKQVVIRDVRRDAWTVHPNDVVGKVWLVKRHPDEVEAFTTICPHLGCSVNYETHQKLFVCPCHNGTFSGGQNEQFGARLAQALGGGPNPPPRNMDTLEVRLVKVEDPTNPKAPPKDYFVEVKYEEFEKGREEKVVKK